MKFLAAAVLAAAVIVPGCTRNAGGGPDLSLPAYRLESYDFNPSSSVKSRITAPPAFLLEHLMKMDGRKNYAPKALTPSELRTVMAYYESLPPLNKKIIRERVVGIYFIDNFLGSGLADFIVGRDRAIYAYLAVNPSVMKSTLTDWMTYREKTCFRQDDPTSDIRVDCGTRYTGLMYILLHETTHIVDYARAVTPYTEEALKKVRSVTAGETDFTRGVWRSYSESAGGFGFRKGITFYGMNGGPRLRMSDCETIYDEFSRSPFVSLYGSQNWAEDLAEFVTFYHVSEKLGQGYAIRIMREGKVLREIRPFDRAEVKKRINTVGIFY